MPARRPLAILCALAALAGPAAGIAAEAASMAASLDELGRGVGIEAAATPGLDQGGRAEPPIAPRSPGAFATAIVAETPGPAPWTAPAWPPTPARRRAWLRVYRC